MNTVFHTLLAKLEEHRADPHNADIVQSFHELAAQAGPVAEQVLAHAAAANPLPKLSGLSELSGRGAAPVAQSVTSVLPSEPGLPPALRPPTTNWGTNQRLDSAREVRQPQSSDQVRRLLLQAVAQKLRVRPIGTTHSSSSIMATSGVLLDSGALLSPHPSAAESSLRACRELHPGLYRLSASERALHIEVGSGAQVKDVNDYLAASQRALRMTGAYSGQTLVGAFCTSTHGGGIAHPPLHSAVRSIQLLSLDAHDQVIELRIEPTQGITDAQAYGHSHPEVRLVQSDDWFYAAVVAMGAMGFITSMIIEAVPKFSLLQRHWKGTWDECKKLLRDLGDDGAPRFFAGSHHSSISLTPYAMPLFLHGRQTTVMSRAYRSETPPPEYHSPSQSNLSPLLILAGRFAGNQLPALSPLLIDQALGGDVHKPTFGPSYKILGNPDNLPPGYSAEYAFPLDRYLDAVDEILVRMAELAARKSLYMVGPLTLRWVAGDRAFLSMSEGSAPRVYAEFLSLAGAGHGLDVLADIEGLALKHGGRPHWGQWWSPQALPQILALYPQYAGWQAIYRQLNVSGLFSNEFTDGLR